MAADASTADASTADASTARSRSQEVYERLRASIIHGMFRPNERLVEDELAEQLGTSRTPIREGLQRLALEGLVTSRRRGWVVREYTPDEIEEIYEVRMALEGYAARLAAERANAQQLEHIAAIYRDKERELVRARRDVMIDLNETFHDAVTAATGNKRLVEQIRRNRAYYVNYPLPLLYTEEEALASLAEHDRIVQALSDRDADQAERVAREHIGRALELILSRIR